MARKSRIDAPGALHHIICRGSERKPIFRDDEARDRLLERLGAILLDTSTSCFARALIPNHFHLLLRTGAVPIATVMRRLLTGYAVTFNHRHGRHGQLFQNRYKSILCEEETYLLELVRYIHLNSVRARLVADVDALEQYPYSGHAVLTGKNNNDWQDAEYILARFVKNFSRARQKYREFMHDGVVMGKRPELTGGGLIRSLGGWQAAKKSSNKMDSKLISGRNMLILQAVIGILQSWFVLYATWWMFSYYTGRIGFSGQAEERRKRKVKKFGWLFIFCIVITLFAGVILLISKLCQLIILLI
ncbi:MAG: transposase [Deltaproteobacteria bacterium]|nr:transposase [Deltaproteobacteria bacterium]